LTNTNLNPYNALAQMRTVLSAFPLYCAKGNVVYLGFSQVSCYSESLRKKDSILLQLFHNHSWKGV